MFFSSFFFFTYFKKVLKSILHSSKYNTSVLLADNFCYSYNLKISSSLIFRIRAKNKLVALAVAFSFFSSKKVMGVKSQNTVTSQLSTKLMKKDDISQKFDKSTSARISNIGAKQVQKLMNSKLLRYYMHCFHQNFPCTYLVYV